VSASKNARALLLWRRQSGTQSQVPLRIVDWIMKGGRDNRKEDPVYVSLEITKSVTKSKLSEILVTTMGTLKRVWGDGGL
jgi:hypothetical protein